MKKKYNETGHETFLSLTKMLKRDFGKIIFLVWVFTVGFLVGWIAKCLL